MHNLRSALQIILLLGLLSGNSAIQIHRAFVNYDSLEESHYEEAQYSDGRWHPGAKVTTTWNQRSLISIWNESQLLFEYSDISASYSLVSNGFDNVRGWLVETGSVMQILTALRSQHRNNATSDQLFFLLGEQFGNVELKCQGDDTISIFHSASRPHNYGAIALCRNDAFTLSSALNPENNYRLILSAQTQGGLVFIVFDLIVAAHEAGRSHPMESFTQTGTEDSAHDADEDSDSVTSTSIIDTLYFYSIHEQSSAARKRPRDEDSCPICHEGLEADQISAVHGCDHEFHTRCISKWLETKREEFSCPICRGTKR